MSETAASRINKRAAFCALTIFIAIVGFLVFLLVLLFKLFAYFVTGFGATLIFLVSFFLLGRLLVRVMLFPGSLFFIRRNMEYHFCKEMAKQVLDKVNELKMVLEAVMQEEIDLEKTDLLH